MGAYYAGISLRPAADRREALMWLSDIAAGVGLVVFLASAYAVMFLLQYFAAN